MERKINPAPVSVVNPILDLLQELRANPTEDCIQRIVDFVREEHGDYYHLRKAVELAIARPLTEAELALAGQLQ